MAKVKITDRDLGWNSIKQEIEKFGKMIIKVGIVEGSGEIDGVDIAYYAAVNEAGYKDETGKTVIPSRPFIRSWIDSNENQILAVMQSVFRRVLTGQLSAEEAMKLIGEFVQSGIKKNITQGSFEKNADSTIKKKGSSRPLIDTGTMRNAIRYRVVKKK